MAGFSPCPCANSAAPASCSVKSFTVAQLRDRTRGTGLRGRPGRLGPRTSAAGWPPGRSLPRSQEAVTRQEQGLRSHMWKGVAVTHIAAHSPGRSPGAAARRTPHPGGRGRAPGAGPCGFPRPEAGLAAVTNPGSPLTSVLHLRKRTTVHLTLSERDNFTSLTSPIHHRTRSAESSTSRPPRGNAGVAHLLE